MYVCNIMRVGTFPFLCPRALNARQLAGTGHVHYNIHLLTFSLVFVFCFFFFRVDVCVCVCVVLSLVFIYIAKATATRRQSRRRTVPRMSDARQGYIYIPQERSRERGIFRGYRPKSRE